MDSLPESIGNELDEARQKLLRLEQEHSRCVEELKAAEDAAEESAANAKNAADELQYFVYAASHDLQQPLRAVNTHAQLLQRRFPDDEIAREFTKVIVEGATQMNGLITDLLTYSRVGNHFDPQPVHLSAPLQWALFTLNKVIGESQAQVAVGEMYEVSGNEKQLATVFENLIGNAIKFRAAAPLLIEINAQCEERQVIVSVRDNGSGIKPEYLERVFEPFKRLHSKDIPGNGLGLSICRKIMRAHHGKIWIESNGDTGSVAKFALPR
ncbi:MAG TPA: ATP-binding protein [Bryobacteraceae bacterium]|jgi:signal transduction histidine kinase|nr:ATP-binding protein [Bryobacteraceae bacterium]